MQGSKYRHMLLINYNCSAESVERRESPTEFNHHVMYFHMLPAASSQAFDSVPEGGSKARRSSIMHPPIHWCVFFSNLWPTSVHHVNLTDPYVYRTKWTSTTAASLHCFRGWDNDVCSLTSHDPLLRSIIQRAHSRLSGKKSDIPNRLIIPMKRSSASFIKTKSVTIQTFAVTRGIIIDFFIAISCLLNTFCFFKKTPCRMFSLPWLRWFEESRSEKHLLRRPWATHGVSEGWCVLDYSLGCSAGTHKNGFKVVQFYVIERGRLLNFPLSFAVIQKSNKGSKYSFVDDVGCSLTLPLQAISDAFSPLPTDSVHNPQLVSDNFYSWRHFKITVFLFCLAGFGTESTGWLWTLTTIWTSTVLTTRVPRPTGAWSATSCSWSTTRATLPASTGCVASSAGSATAPAVLTGPCASQRSSSSSPPSPWALSSGLDTSTTTSVGYQPGSVCSSVCCVCVCTCVCTSATAQYAFVNDRQSSA